MSGEAKIERWVERQFWQEVRAGRSVAGAADAVGVSDSAGKRWFRDGGGMPTLSLAEPPARFLSTAEREEIAARAGRMSIRRIADHPKGHLAGTAAAHLPGGGVEDVDAPDLDDQLVTVGPNVNVWLSEDREQVARAGFLEVFAHKQFDIHPHKQHRDAPDLPLTGEVGEPLLRHGDADLRRIDRERARSKCTSERPLPRPTG
jgi:hypothetical protein